MNTLRLIRAEWTERDIRMRLPFQFGNTEVWGAPEAYLTLAAEFGGRVVSGRSAQLMVPRWFNKNPELSNEDTINELRSVLAKTVAVLPDRRGSVYAITRELREDEGSALPQVPALAAGFGPALVEMAAIDAVCQGLGVPFWKAAKGDGFGIADHCSADIKPLVRQSLSKIAAPRRIRLRHTVGFDAPIRSTDSAAAEVRDGRPVALEDVLNATGITALKIKLKGDPERDLKRLRSISDLVQDRRGLSVTLDANEQYDPKRFDAFLAGFQNDRSLETLRTATRFVEQPFPRETALNEPVSAAIPLVIDESDDTEDAFARALSLGWSGTSIKSCKGVLRALLNKAQADASGAILSGEDLTCQPGLCWQQDVLMMSACDVQDVERNGHHFAGGMQGAPDAEREAVLRAHPDIYVQHKDRIALRIADGGVQIGSLATTGFGA